jgi:hypothetical protein
MCIYVLSLATRSLLLGFQGDLSSLVLDRIPPQDCVSVSDKAHLCQAHLTIKKI